MTLASEEWDHLESKATSWPGDIFIKPFSTVLYSNKYDTDNSSENKSNEQNAIYMSNKASIISKLENMKINQLKLITKRFNVKPKDLRKAELIDLCTSLILNNLKTWKQLVI